MKKQKVFLKKLLLGNVLANKVFNKNFKRKFPESALYWEHRYSNNGTSGMGSYGDMALYKAGILNQFVTDNGIEKVIEFGCGDGNQLGLLNFPLYIGLDVSSTAIEKCARAFKTDTTKSFFIYHHKAFIDHRKLFLAELSISLDVIYHLLEDEVYEKYMHHLFSASSKFVIIYAWDEDSKNKLYVRHRKFSAWIADKERDWSLVKRIEHRDAATCDFFIYQKEPKL